MGRPQVPLPQRVAASLVIVGAAVLLYTMYDAIKAATNKEGPGAAWPNTGTLSWQWIETCDQNQATGPAKTHPKPAVKGQNYFTLHMFFMTLAFGFFGPVASVMYFVLEDTLKMNHDVVKWLHGLVQTGAVVASVLGFLQIYYSNGGYCAFAVHFDSLHSYVGIVLLAAYWLQGPLALLIFSNKTLLKPGTAARRGFLQAHRLAGVGLTLLGPVVMMMGIMAFEVKRSQWNSDNSWLGDAADVIWVKMARAGMVAFGLLVLLFCVHRAAPDADAKPSEKVAIGDPLLYAGTSVPPVPADF